jgi:hypothetical protein
VSCTTHEREPAGAEGLADARLVAAIYESTRTGKFAPVQEFHKAIRPSLRQQTYRPAHPEPKPLQAAPPSGEAP